MNNIIANELNTVTSTTTSDLNWPMTTPSKLKAYNIKEFLELQIPVAEYILHPILCERRHIMIYAPRGAGKTWFCLSLAYSAATGITLIERYPAQKPCKVLYIDGEMSAYDLQQRIASITGGDIPQGFEDNFKILTHDLCAGPMPNIADTFGQDEYEPFIKNVDVIFVDNVSSLMPHANENDSEGWAKAKEWSLEMRRRGKSVVFVHHAGKNGQQRGTSAREDSLDVVLALKHPPGYRTDQGARFNVYFEKARGFFGQDAMPFSLEMSCTEKGIKWHYKPLTSNADREKKDQRLDQVLKLSADGNTTRAIADATGIPRSTVQRMLQSSKLAAN